MLVRDSKTLCEFCRHAQAQPYCAVDTEFVWTKTYLPALALIQLATPTELVLVDMLAIDAVDCLRELLTAPQTVKVFHAADQDLRLLHQHFDSMVVDPLWDSQIGAALLGYGYQTGYGRLVQDILGVSLDKSSQFTDWLARPLRTEQLDYAADDVRYLVQLFPQLRDKLIALQRWEWSLEDCHRMVTQTELAPLAPEHAYQNVRGHARLRAVEHYALRRLAHWREEQARQLNQRPRHLVPDPVLLQVASGRELTPRHWHKVIGSVRRYAQSLLPTLTELAREARQAAKGMQVVQPRHRVPTATERDAKTAAELIVDSTAKELGIEREVLATQADLSNLVRGLYEARSLDHNRLVSGWRADVVGSRLVDCIRLHLQR